MKTKYYKTLSVLGLLMSLITPLRMNLLDPGEGGGGGGGNEPPADEMDPLLSALFNTVDADKSDDGKAAAPGMSLQQAIEEPSADDKAAADKKAADEKAAADKKAAEEKAEADKKAAEEKRIADEAEAAKNPPAPIKVVRKAAAPAPDAAAEAAAKKAEAEKADREKFEAELLEEEREQLKIARFAEKKDPAKYKGVAERTEKFLREHKAKTEAADFDANAPEYKSWLEKNQPRFTALELRNLDREMIREEITSDSKKQQAEVLDKVFRNTETPRVQAEADAFFSRAMAEALPEAVAAAMKEGGHAKAKELHPLEFEIADRVLAEQASDIEEMLMLTRKNPDTGTPLKAFDKANPQHGRVLALINEVCDEFKKSGGAELVRAGKKFLTREEMVAATPEQKAKSWTFSSKEIVQRSIGVTKARIAREVAAEDARLARLGYGRKAAAPVQTEAEKKAAADKAAAEAAEKNKTTTPAAPRSAPVGGGGGGDQESAHDKMVKESLFGTPES